MLRRALLASIFTFGLAAAAHADTPGDYVYAGSLDVGAPGGWDYLSYAGGKVYLGHATKVDAVDVTTGKVVGTVTPVDHVHGAAIDAALGRGFATSGAGDGALLEFDLADYHVIKSIPIAPDADGVIFDPGSGDVIVTAGDSKHLAIVDPKAESVTHLVDLPGEPEFVAADGKGKVFVNISSTSQISRIDLASGKIEGTWPLTGCQNPSGLVYDHKTHRLFAGCRNQVVVAVDPDGKVLSALPAGPFNDAMLVDEKRGRVFCTNGDGTLTVISEGAGDNFKVLRTIPTFLGARSGAVDPATGDLYLTYGQVQLARGPTGITFSWSGAKIAVFKPAD